MTTLEEIARPGAIFRRIKNAIESAQKETCVDGGPDYHLGFADALALAAHIVTVEEGNFACEASALRSRSFTNPEKD